MNYLLIGGAPSVGKSESIYKLAQTLLTPARGFTIITGIFPPIINDFKIVIEGIDKSGVKIKILINSGTDNKKIIENFKNFHDVNKPFDIIISSVRDISNPRIDFFSIMKISTADIIVEIPLAKVRRGKTRTTALIWYQDKLDALILNTISNAPFNL
ncbi:hypothetical protein [Flavobacterium sp.]|uniref:hypothetical protein n=1 Tax=Flavobacterium sp. TaxID=239 RepID=UPI0037523021